MVKYTNAYNNEFYLPKSKEEWTALKNELIDRGLVEDSPESWTFVLSQLQGTKMPELTNSIDNIVCHYQRWKIAEVLQKEKAIYIEELQAKLRQALEALPNEGISPSPTSDNDLPIGAHNLQGNVPQLPDTPEGMVSPTSDGRSF